MNILQEKLLKKTGWHHTSKMFNRTDFYEIDENVVNDLSIEEANTWMEEARREKKEKTELKPVRYSADVNYLEWYGSRKHPRASEHRLVGVMVEERGCFCYIYDQEGHFLFRKKIESKGTNVTRKSENA